MMEDFLIAIKNHPYVSLAVFIAILFLIEVIGEAFNKK